MTTRARPSSSAPARGVDALSSASSLALESATVRRARPGEEERARDPR